MNTAYKPSNTCIALWPASRVPTFGDKLDRQRVAHRHQEQAANYIGVEFCEVYLIFVLRAGQGQSDYADVY